MNRALIALIVSLSFPATFAHAADEVISANEPQFASEADRQNYYSIDTVEVSERALQPGEARVAYQAMLREQALRRSHGGFSEAAVATTLLDIITPADLAEKWIALGAKIWDIVENNRPSATTKSAHISILPRSQPDWTQIENWKGPVTKSFHLEAKNAFGMVVASEDYNLSYLWGGNFAGAGSYLSNVTIAPMKVDVIFGMKLNAHVEVGDAYNVATQDNPVPAVQLDHVYQISSLIKLTERREQYLVKGDGTSVRVNP